MQLLGSNRYLRHGNKIAASVGRILLIASLSFVIPAWKVFNASTASVFMVPSRAVVVYQVSLLRPLVSLDVVSSVLNVTRDDARGLIEDGSLLWAFDLSVKQSRPLVRVFSQSLADYARIRTAPKSGPEFSAVLQAIFPVHGKAIRSSLLCRAWSVDEDHTLNLWRAGLLRLADGSECKSGCNGSPALDFASVAEFMEERQLC